MIQVKLSELAQKLGKTITDIAIETGLNRNTITALFHNKVDGIKFETLEKICTTYHISVDDILDFEETLTKQTQEHKLYRQEGAVVPFTTWQPMLATNTFDKKFFSMSMGGVKVYFRGPYGWMYWDYHAMRKFAQKMYADFSDTSQLKTLYKTFQGDTQTIEHFYRERNFKQLLSLDSAGLIQHHRAIMDAYSVFWDHSIFIDTFDAGDDQEEIAKVAQRYSLGMDEVVVLTTSEKMTFSSERLLDFLNLVKYVIKKNRVTKISDEKLRDLLSSEPKTLAYIHEYEYYKSNYTYTRPIVVEEIVEEMQKFLKDKNLLEETYREVSNYEKIQQRKVKAVLRKHRLKTNPLEFFSLLTYWRERRKQVNLMGICSLDVILRVMEEKTGIQRKYLQYMNYDEIGSVLRGVITRSILEHRCNDGVFIIVPKDDTDDYQIFEGKEAESLRDELEKKLQEKTDDETIVVGQTACQGYAKGVARIILDDQGFDRLKPGEILVTGMTRPEFVPLMKIAGGIVTNEGGITCHAAIVSRELGKPCIIGTKNATERIKDGELIEVRANHGTVRILR